METMNRADAHRHMPMPLDLTQKDILPVRLAKKPAVAVILLKAVRRNRLARAMLAVTMAVDKVRGKVHLLDEAMVENLAMIEMSTKRRKKSRWRWMTGGKTNQVA